MALGLPPACVAMTLRRQIIGSQETLTDVTWAAEQRFRDAETPFRAGRFAGAVYLFGLSSEMWVKLACFHLRGATPSTPVRGLLGPARTWMRAQAPAIDPEQYHSLLFWCEYLIRLRHTRGLPMSARLAGLLRHHVANRLHSDWTIDMRYRSAAVYGSSSPNHVAPSDSNRLGRANTPGARRLVPDRSVRPATTPRTGASDANARLAHTCCEDGSGV